jgi:arylsulfatase A-like enzyme
VTDDQREGLSVLPTVRRYFIREGVRYRPGFVTTPVCCPSRASIMTGRYAHNHMVKSNSSSGESGADALDHSTTLQAYLHSAGYHTGTLGKFLNPPWSLSDNPPYFDEWVTLGGEPRNKAWYDATYNVNGTVKTLHGYTTNVLARRATGFIRRNAPGSQPWYLYVATKAPHLPAIPEEEYSALDVGDWDGDPAVFEEDRSDKPPYVAGSTRTIDYGRSARTKQLRALASVDDMAASIFSELKMSGELKNTLAFFISDNGLMWGEHGLGGKGVPYRQAISVPFMARWPRHLTPGTDHRWAANIDIAPTVLDAAGIVPTVAQDGRSLLRPWERDRILLEAWCNGSPTCHRWISTWGHGYQYTEYWDQGAITFREYYDLHADPWQLENLLGDDDPQNDPQLDAIESQLAADKDCTGALCP